VPQLRGDILLCDDERSVREFLAIYLKRVGHRIETVANTAEARAAIAAREFDVLITDLRMPDGTGLDVLEASKKLRPETQVIVVTAYATAETAIAAMKAGAYDYLLTPFKGPRAADAAARERHPAGRDPGALPPGPPAGQVSPHGTPLRDDPQDRAGAHQRVAGR
jgi:DNA-binding NtrC family response regulator